MKIIIPINHIREIIITLMGWIYTLAVWCDDFLLMHMIDIKLDVKGLKKQYPEKFYIIIANHQSWNDIFILQHLFNRRAPLLKFLVKRELIFLPIVGLICWAYDYPFLRRHSTKGQRANNEQQPKDAATLEKALHSFISYPASIINLVEGTRFSPVKARIQKSPYDYLLRPRAGGLTTMLEILGNRVGIIIDVTIVYDCEDPTFWNLLCGKCKSVYVSINEHATSEIAQINDIKAISTWINSVWREKDMKIKAIQQCLRQ
jgi:1-acyl-sn-glycerol-3-phosphate acyltransferase